MKQKTKDAIEIIILIMLTTLLGTILNYSFIFYTNGIIQKVIGLLALAVAVACFLYARIKAINAEFKGF